ncbi:MAG: rhodanese-like domain-containing protein [Terrimicrobiaceae bacterium]
MRVLLALAFIFLTLPGTMRADSASERLAAYSAQLQKEFSDVPGISTSQLAAINPAPMLLDVREKDEFAVSHLPGAHRAESDTIAQLRKLGASENTFIVVYCSVGYRSAVLARKLQKAGFVNVRNLEGSIFAWANEGRPLVNLSGATSGVHPFNAYWGRYLDKSKWRWKP